VNFPSEATKKMTEYFRQNLRSISLSNSTQTLIILIEFEKLKTKSFLSENLYLSEKGWEIFWLHYPSKTHDLSDENLTVMGFFKPKELHP
jgi:hypothetical protein